MTQDVDELLAAATAKPGPTSVFDLHPEIAASVEAALERLAAGEAPPGVTVYGIARVVAPRVGRTPNHVAHWIRGRWPELSGRCKAKRS